MKMDKFEVKASKRKKRRTRRNLDEMRKRTLQVHSINNNETICQLEKPQVKNCITNNRLTLANRVIRSETVTRSLLSTLNKEKNKNMIVLPNRKEVIDTKVSNVNYKKDTISLKVNAKLKSPLCNYMKIDNHKTPDSTILFSSLESEKLVNNITINDFLSDSSQSSAALSFVMQSDNSLYSEFMTNIVNYVQEFESDFLKTDTVLKANFLQNVIYNKNKNIPTSQSYMNKNEIKIKTKSTITDNDEAVSQYPKSQKDINMQFSLEKPWNIPSPVFHQSHEINFHKCVSASSSACSGEDSPEYFYYPHRLNQ